MDQSDFPVSRSPRRELQGPRPTPLKVRADSHKIKKPPIPPQHQQRRQQQQQQQQEAQPQAPVIIYSVSPKVIHTDPSEFMTLVQRLTGFSSSSSTTTTTTTTTTTLIDNSGDGALSPAARYAAIERANSSSSPEGKRQLPYQGDNSLEFTEGMEIIDQAVDRATVFPGILSPGPSLLPPISPGFFSPLSDPSFFRFLHDLSPVLNGNKISIDRSFMPSPTGFISPYVTSPPAVDLFSIFSDL